MTFRRFLFSLALLITTSAFAQFTYIHKTAVSKGTLTIESNAINTQAGSDLVSLGAGDVLTSGFFVNASDGVGGYFSPRFHAVPAQFFGTIRAVAGDFTGDGKVDLAVSRENENLYFYKGNQSSAAGYFDPPVILPLGVSNASLLKSMAAADFNHDGKLDLIIATEDDFMIALGNGNGTFQPLDWIWNSDPDVTVFTGDFDGDSRADLVQATESYVNFFFADAAGGYVRPPLVVSDGRTIAYSHVVDINGDGRSDLVGVSTDQQPPIVRILKGRSNRTFAVTDVPLTKETVAGSSSVDVADFDGDGRPDLVVLERDNASRYIAILYGQADGTFSPEEFVFSDLNLREVMAGKYNSGTVPDIVARAASTQFGDGTLHIFRNTHTYAGAQFPGCDPLSNPASNVRVCSITSTDSASATFHVGAAFTSPLRKVELWVDGAKLAESFNSYDQYAFMDKKVSVSPGLHAASIYAVSFDGLNLNTKLPFQVGTSTVCAAPTAVGINVCSPGSTANSPVAVNATGKTANTTVRMELWVDGTRRASVSGNNLQTNVALAAGTHRFTFFAFDSSGSKISVVRNVAVN